MTRFNLVNFLAFQCAWFATVLGAAAGVPWAGFVCTATWIALHLAALGAGWRREVALLAAAGCTGYLFDSALVLGGQVAFPATATLGGPASLWMTALWVNLAATLRHSLAWLAPWPVAGALFGFLGGPLAYLAGERLGALIVADGFMAPLAIGAAWALAMPALMHAAHGDAARLDTVRP